MNHQDQLATITLEELVPGREAEVVADQRRIDIDNPQVLRAVKDVLSATIRAGVDAGDLLARRGTYLVEFSAEGTAALRAGSARFLKRTNGTLQPTLMGRGFQENAVLIGPGAARGAVAAMAVAQLVIILAVHSQLVSMERSLARIEGKIDALQRWLDQDKLARVKGRLRALQRLRDELATVEWTGDVRLRCMVALDQADAEFHQAEELARMQGAHVANETREQRMGVHWRGPTGETIAARFADLVDRRRISDELAVCALHGRLVVAALRVGLGASPAADDLARELASARSAAQEYAGLLEERALEFSTWFRSAKRDVTVRKRLRDDARDNLARLDAVLSRMDAHVIALANQRLPAAHALVAMSEGAISDVTLLAPSA
jgi:hypothetical protein